MRIRWLVTIWTLAAAHLWWWTARNPLPDGFQNEYLHVGNAYDLWGALAAFDQWHLRWFMYTGYWPWGFYAVPWPFLAVLGPGRLALLLGNLVHLAVLLWGANSLGRSLGARLAPAVLVLCPGVFGPLVRFEPNLAAIAWVTAGLAFLVRSNGLRERREVLGFGAALGLGLLMDRITVGLFLLPAVLPLCWRADRRAWKNLGLGGLLALGLTAAWYREFAIRGAAEVLSQAPVGEIDSAGAVSPGPTAPAWYLLALLDSQAGPVNGAVMLLGLAAAIRSAVRARSSPGAWQARAVLVASVLAPLALFTLVAKKQVFYTLPALGPLAVLAATRARLAWVCLAAGLWAFAGTGLGLAPRGFPGTPWMPERWVAPRHTLARPPSRQRWPLDEAAAVLPAAPGGVAVLSEDDALYEGFVVLALRERRPGASVRGVITDPVGTYELFGTIRWLVRVGPPGVGWPDEDIVARELLDDHYDLAALPPVGAEVARGRDAFVERARAAASGVEIAVFEREEGGPPPRLPR